MRTSIRIGPATPQMVATGVRPVTVFAALTVPVTVTSFSVPSANGARPPCAVKVTWAIVPTGAKPVPVAVNGTGIGPNPGALKTVITGAVYVNAAVLLDWLPSWKITRAVPASVVTAGLPHSAASG